MSEYDRERIYGSPSQFAQLTNLSQHFIRQLIAEGKMPGFKVNSAFKINFPQALKMLDEMSEVTANE